MFQVSHLRSLECRARRYAAGSLRSPPLRTGSEHLAYAYDPFGRCRIRMRLPKLASSLGSRRVCGSNREVAFYSEVGGGYLPHTVSPT